jgi:hypothetical protein
MLVHPSPHYKNGDPVQKIKTKTGIFAQVIAHLYSNHEVLSSITSTTMEKKEKEVTKVDQRLVGQVKE